MPDFQNNFPFARRLRLPLLTLQFCFCFDFRVLISQKKNPGKIQSGEKKVGREDYLVYQATF